MREMHREDRKETQEMAKMVVRLDSAQHSTLVVFCSLMRSLHTVADRPKRRFPRICKQAPVCFTPQFWCWGRGAALGGANLACARHRSGPVAGFAG